MQHCPRYKEATSDQDLTGGELLLSTLRQRILCDFANTGDNFILTSILSFYFFFFFFCYFVLAFSASLIYLKFSLQNVFFCFLYLQFTLFYFSFQANLILATCYYTFFLLY